MICLYCFAAVDKILTEIVHHTFSLRSGPSCSVLSQEIGGEEHLQNDLFCMRNDVKMELNLAELLEIIENNAWK